MAFDKGVSHPEVLSLLLIFCAMKYQGMALLQTDKSTVLKILH